jgi:hypothetical protein
LIMVAATGQSRPDSGSTGSVAANVKRRVAFMHGLLIDKMCNALLPDAAPSGLCSGAASATAGHMHERLSGLWVGGRVQASSDAITFTPNGMNAALHSGLQPVRIPLATVSAARRDFGWPTGRARWRRVPLPVLRRQGRRTHLVVSCVGNLTARRAHVATATK